VKNGKEVASGVWRDKGGRFLHDTKQQEKFHQKGWKGDPAPNLFGSYRGGSGRKTVTGSQASSNPLVFGWREKRR